MCEYDSLLLSYVAPTFRIEGVSGVWHMSVSNTSTDGYIQLLYFLLISDVDASVVCLVSMHVYVLVLITINKHLMLFVGSGSGNSNAFRFSKYVSKALEIRPASFNFVRI